MSEMRNHVTYHAVTKYGNEFNSWDWQEISNAEEVEKFCDFINATRYDDHASITVISWQQYDKPLTIEKE